MKTQSMAAVAAALAFTICGCDSKPASSHDGHTHDAAEKGTHDGHAHAAEGDSHAAAAAHDEHEHSQHTHDLPARGPNGGALIPLGDHLATLELVLDPAAGRLSAYVLDCGASEAIRCRQPSIRVRIDAADGVTTPLDLAAVANALTGETVGDTSQFAAEHAVLRGAARIQGQLEQIDIRGQQIVNLRFECGAGG